MGCLFAIFAGCFPRVGTLLIWLARPDLFAAAFGGSWLWPVIGVIFLPYTTLMWALVWASGPGIGGIEWLWLILALVLDLLHWTSASAATYRSRDRIPAYTRSAA